jgi:ABC-type multidrug transport system ATPase subunit
MVTSHLPDNESLVKAISIEELELRQRDSTLFSHLTLALDPGEKVALTAPSGYGKSTLIRCLLGFVPIHQGRISIFGTELTPRSAWQLRLRMAYVDQEPDLGDGSVDAFLSRPFSYKKNQHLHFDSERVTAMMSQLHLPHSLRNKKTSSLSGGEKQRVSLIGALLLNRDILFVDEPTSALDQEAALAVVDLLNTMRNLTVVAIVHDQSLTNAVDRTVDLLKVSRRPG